MNNRGENHHKAILTDDDVREIRRLGDKREAVKEELEAAMKQVESLKDELREVYSISSWAEYYGVSAINIYNILAYKTRNDA